MALKAAPMCEVWSSLQPEADLLLRTMTVSCAALPTSSLRAAPTASRECWVRGARHAVDRPGAVILTLFYPRRVNVTGGQRWVCRLFGGERWGLSCVFRRLFDCFFTQCLLPKSEPGYVSLSGETSRRTPLKIPTSLQLLRSVKEDHTGLRDIKECSGIRNTRFSIRHLENASKRRIFDEFSFLPTWLTLMWTIRSVLRWMLRGTPVEPHCKVEHFTTLTFVTASWIFSHKHYLSANTFCLKRSQCCVERTILKFTFLQWNVV